MRVCTHTRVAELLKKSSWFIACLTTPDTSRLPTKIENKSKATTNNFVSGFMAQCSNFLSKEEQPKSCFFITTGIIITTDRLLFTIFHQDCAYFP